MHLVITFKLEGVQKNDFLQLFCDRKDVAEYLENETKGTNVVSFHPLVWHPSPVVHTCVLV